MRFIGESHRLSALVEDAPVHDRQRRVGIDMAVANQESWAIRFTLTMLGESRGYKPRASSGRRPAASAAAPSARRAHLSAVVQKSTGGFTLRGHRDPEPTHKALEKVPPQFEDLAKGVKEMRKLKEQCPDMFPPEIAKCLDEPYEGETPAKETQSVEPTKSSTDGRAAFKVESDEPIWMENDPVDEPGPRGEELPGAA